MLGEPPEPHGIVIAFSVIGDSRNRERQPDLRLLESITDCYRVKAPYRTLVARLLAITWLPEFNVGLFALLLNFPWEFFQTPLFEGLSRMPHWEAVKGCTRATFGDAVIVLIAYWSVATAGSGRNWIMTPTRLRMTAFVLVGVSITVAIESLATRGWWYSGWSYTPDMPLLPGLEVGLVPLLQWIVLPPLVVVLARRQLRGLSI